jgi:hypothetical protein
MKKLTIEQVAKQLNGCEIGDEGSDELFDACEKAGIVVLYGASDDLAEFRGAFTDEVGCYDGGDIPMLATGLPKNECHDDDCPYYLASLKGARNIEAVWCDDEIGSSWSYKTDIPHVTFDVMEDGELYCRGIVFRLADVQSAKETR